jgi:hypothetical protein
MYCVKNTCACPMGVDSTQCMVASQLLGQLEPAEHIDMDQRRRTLSGQAALLDGDEYDTTHHSEGRGRTASEVFTFERTVFPDHADAVEDMGAQADSTPVSPANSVLLTAIVGYDVSGMNKVSLASCLCSVCMCVAF